MIKVRYYLHAVRKSQPDQTSGYAVSLSDGKQSNEEHNESSQGVRPKAEPPAIIINVIVFCISVLENLKTFQCN